MEVNKIDPPFLMPAFEKIYFVAMGWDVVEVLICSYWHGSV